MKLVVRIYTILLIINFVQCTIDGISYLDELKSKDLFNNFPKRDNPCNPLYWYPRQIPDYCYAPKFLNPPNVKLESKPTPPMQGASGIIAPGIPSPMIPPPMIPPPMIHSPIIPPPMVSSPMIHSPIIPPPMVSSPMIHSPIIPPPMISSPMIPSPPALSPYPSLSYSAPLVAPNPMVPMIPQNPYGGFQYPQLPQQTAGMIPGLPGIVSRDGRINILPFSDAYSDLLEKHKQKVIRKKLEKVLRRYEDYPRPRHLWRRKKFKKVFFDNE